MSIVNKNLMTVKHQIDYLSPYHIRNGRLMYCDQPIADYTARIIGMIGTDIPNSRLREFESAIEDGHILMMVDIPKARVDEVSRMVREHHPEADVHGTEPAIPAFP